MRCAGLSMGKVRRVAIDSADPRLVLVTLRLRDDTPVRTSTRAAIVSAGASVASYVNLRPGLPNARALAAGARVPVEQGPTIEDVMRRVTILRSRAREPLPAASPRDALPGSGARGGRGHAGRGTACRCADVGRPRGRVVAGGASRRVGRRRARRPRSHRSPAGAAIRRELGVPQALAPCPPRPILRAARGPTRARRARTSRGGDGEQAPAGQVPQWLSCPCCARRCSNRCGSGPPRR